MTNTPPIVEPGARDAQFWLNAANQAVRSYCGWHVAPVITETLTLDGNGGRVLLLPTGKLRTLIRCTNAGVNVLPFVDASDKGMLQLHNHLWTKRFGQIVVEIEHGFEAAADVAGVVASLAARGASTPAGIVSQGIGPANVRYSEIPMLKTEQQILDPYRIQWGA